MSYTHVYNEREEIERLKAEIVNITRRHCKIGKVRTKPDWLSRQVMPSRAPLVTPGMAAPFNPLYPPTTTVPDFIWNPVTSISH